MRDIGAAHHAAEDCAQSRVGKHLLGEDDEGVMHIVLWYGSGDAIQVSRSHAQKALSRIGLDVVCVSAKAGPRRDDDPATVDYLREQAPYSQYNGYSLRRDRCSFDSTLQEGNRMTICSWRTQSQEHPLNFVLSTC
jgi:hypothetical protein